MVFMHLMRSSAINDPIHLIMRSISHTISLCSVVIYQIIKY